MEPHITMPVHNTACEVEFSKVDQTTQPIPLGVIRQCDFSANVCLDVVNISAMKAGGSSYLMH